MAKYTLFCVQVGSTHIPVSSGGYDPRLEPILDGSAGVDNLVGGLGGSKPLVSFTSHALGTALTAVSSIVLAISTGTPLKLWFAKLAGQALSTSADNVCVTCNAGLLGIMRARGRKGAAAELDFEFVARYDGTNAPFVVATNASLPTVTAQSTLYKLYAAVLAYGVSSTLQVQLEDVDISTGLVWIQDNCSADIHPTFTAVGEFKPKATLTSPDVGGVLAVTGLFGLVCTGCTVYFAKFDGPAHASGSVHASFVLNDPTVLVESINPSHNKCAMVSLSALATYDGSNEPVVTSYAAALPAAESMDEMYTLGWTVIDSVVYEALSWEYRANNSEDQEGHSGNYRPTNADLLKRDPEFSVTSNNVGSLAWCGESITSGEFYLRKIPADGTRTADATEEHIKLSISAALTGGDVFSGQWGQRAENRVSIRPIKSGVNAVVSLDLTAGYGV